MEILQDCPSAMFAYLYFDNHLLILCPAIISLPGWPQKTVELVPSRPNVFMKRFPKQGVHHLLLLIKKAV